MLIASPQISFKMTHNMWTEWRIRIYLKLLLFDFGCSFLLIWRIPVWLRWGKISLDEGSACVCTNNPNTLLPPTPHLCPNHRAWPMQLTVVLCCDCCVNGCRVLRASSIKRHPCFHALITALCVCECGWVGRWGGWSGVHRGEPINSKWSAPPQINTIYTASHTECQNHYSYWRRMHVCVQANAPISCVCLILPLFLHTHNVNMKCKRSGSLALQWQLTMCDTKSIFGLLTDRERMDSGRIWIRTRTEKKNKKDIYVHALLWHWLCTERNKKAAYWVLF